MDVTLRSGDLAGRPAGAAAVGLFEGVGKLSGAAAALDRASRGALTRLVKSGDFSGRFLEIAVLYPTAGKHTRVIVVGLGARPLISEHRVRQASAKVARRARELGVCTLATIAHGAGEGGLDAARAAHACAEGSILGHYRFTAYRRDAGSASLQRIEIVERDAVAAASMKPAVVRGAAWAEAVCLARDLANMPGQDLTPARLADRAREIGKGAGATVDVLEPAQMERLGMGALLAVGRGSVHPARFIVLDRAPDAARRGAKAKPGTRPATLVLIGKGVTFDTGGISLKPRENMNKMKYDMSGAAAVLGVFAALPTLDLPFRVVGLIPSAENMPGGRALKPGDVVRALDGTTIEITNTDAEGRLILADALGYARRFEPETVVDLATLTGAVSIALGTLAAGLFTDDDALADELIAAGTTTGERLWRLPLWDEYLNDMKSDTADLVNSSVREGGAILGAVFLKHFARGLRWAHLDIASTAWSAAERAHEGRGPTGFGVRLLLEWLQRRAGAPFNLVSASPLARRSRPLARVSSKRF